eukprot:365660-Chlamydomonas_euryale.AAC.17
MPSREKLRMLDHVTYWGTVRAVGLGVSQSSVTGSGMFVDDVHVPCLCTWGAFHEPSVCEDASVSARVLR